MEKFHMHAMLLLSLAWNCGGFHLGPLNFLSLFPSWPRMQSPTPTPWVHFEARKRAEKSATDRSERERVSSPSPLLPFSHACTHAG